MFKLAIESPYAGDVEKNVAFCKAVCRYAILNGYAPMASHLFYTQFLDDTVPEERKLGIDAGLEWSAAADEVWFCLPPGTVPSKGMRYAMDRYISLFATYKIKAFTWDGSYLYDIDKDSLPLVETTNAQS